MTRVILLANQDKAQVVAALADFRRWLEQRARIVFEANATSDQPLGEIPPADFVIVLGGDGTLLSQARRVVELNLPVIGVNFGKLGFLVEFSLDELRESWDDLARGQTAISKRMLIHTTVCPAGQDESCHQMLAVNDCVITAGPPFRMIRLELTINPDRHHTGTHFSGDGAIVSTPSGSTAYNISAGGPILAPDLEALALTPICPHSLSFRPVVVHSDDVIQLTIHEANEGTMLVVDGQHTQSLQTGATVTIKAHPTKLNLVKNPAMAYWKRLAKKMQWAYEPDRWGSI